jgi:hypothetical protein
VTELVVDTLRASLPRALRIVATARSTGGFFDFPMTYFLLSESNVTSGVAGESGAALARPAFIH